MISRAIGLLGAACAALAMPTPAPAQQLAPFGSQRITLVVPAVAGGATDIIARIISVHLQKALNQTVIVENRGGGNGNIAALSVVRAPPDGHTLLVGTTNNLAMNQFITVNPGHDPATDYSPVAFIVDAPELVAIPMSFPAKDMKEFVAALKAKPGAYNYGTPGTGTVPHLSSERLLRAVGVTMAHVPFRGSAAAMAEVANGNIQMSMATLASIEPFRQANTARVLAVAGKPRLKGAPEIPTLEEAGFPNLEMSNWWGVLGPKGMNPETVRALNRHLQDAFRAPENVATLERLGLVPYAESPEYFQAFIDKEVKVWKAVIDDLGLKPQ